MKNNNQVLKQITSSINKKGKIKGKNKKETKILKNSCVHHKITKNGKIKPTIFIGENEKCTCYMCGHVFPPSFFEDADINEIVTKMTELNDQNKYTATATNAGNDAVQFFADMGVRLGKYKKMSKKTRNLAEKQHALKKGKNKHKTNSGSSMYGSWEINRK